MFTIVSHFPSIVTEADRRSRTLRKVGTELSSVLLAIRFSLVTSSCRRHRGIDSRSSHEVGCSNDLSEHWSSLVNDWSFSVSVSGVLLLTLPPGSGVFDF